MVVLRLSPSGLSLAGRAAMAGQPPALTLSGLEGSGPSGPWPDDDTLKMAAEAASALPGLGGDGEDVEWFDPFVDFAHRVSRPGKGSMMMVVMMTVMMITAKMMGAPGRHCHHQG
jgi:hypothetical protein